MKSEFPHNPNLPFLDKKRIGNHILPLTLFMEVQHNTEKKQFQLDLGGQLAYSQYMQVGEKMIFTHTEVPIGFEGQGIASKIARLPWTLPEKTILR
ncbi:MAG: N-acetyltransferase [Saprospiraceae bacterium]